MKKLELLKEMIADINNSGKYRGTVFQADDMFFVISDDEIFAAYTNNFPDYFVPEYTKEELEYVQRIEQELDLDCEVFLPWLGGVVTCLEDLVEYYEDEEDEDKVEQIEKLIEVIDDEKSVFYNREQEFLGIFLNQDLEDGVAYVQVECDHDDAYYYDLPFNVGVYEPLYDLIIDESICYPDVIEDCDDCAEQEKECDRWIKILYEIDKYIV